MMHIPIAQQFTPQDFWTRRPAIAERMRHGVTQTLTQLGYVQVPLLQIRSLFLLLLHLSFDNNLIK